jgi:hypothetical protein
MTATPSPTFFDTIGAALKSALIAHNTNSLPHQLVAHIESWEQPNPTFEIWPCPANPEGRWTDGVIETFGPLNEETLHVALNNIDVRGSNVSPVSAYGVDQKFPQSSIGSNFTICNTFWAESALRKRGSDLFLPEPALANFWKVICDSSEVNIHATYDIEWNTPLARTLSTGYVSFLFRFRPTTRLAGGFKDLNAHLLDIPPPESWKLCKQFGTPYSRKTRGKRTRRDDAKAKRSILTALSESL